MLKEIGSLGHHPAWIQQLSLNQTPQFPLQSHFLALRDGLE